MQARKDSTQTGNSGGASSSGQNDAVEASARPMGTKKMHVRNGSGKLSNQMSRKSGERASSSLDVPPPKNEQDLKKVPGVKK